MASRKRKTTRRKSSSTDAVTDYAERVLSGELVAGPHVRAACRRHVRDLEEGGARGLTWDVGEVDRVIRFFSTVLTVEIEVQDEDGQTVSEVVPFHLHASQQFIVGSLFGWKNRLGHRRFRRAYIEIGKGNGKALALDTPIPTPSGWTTMGELAPEDLVFGPDGKPCRVVATSDVMHDRPCYRLTFSDGGAIIADAEHLWRTAAIRSGGRRGPKPGGEPRKGGYAVRSTAEIADTLHVLPSASRHPQAKWNHRVDVAAALDLPDADLPISPYTLGVWLGDGDSDCGRFTCSFADAPEILRRIALEGVECSQQQRHSETTGRFVLRGLQQQLRLSGLLRNKHIPPEYFRASAGQRMELLRGLMDSDGSALKDGAAEFTSTREQLSKDVLALLRTLGFKPHMTESAATLRGREVGRRWRIRVHAYDDQPIFHLQRKRCRQKRRPTTRSLSKGRMIVGCELVESVPVRCIMVDRTDGMYLAGEHLIPTHNSPIAAGIGHYMLTATKKLRAEVYSAATDKDQAAILFRDAVEMWRRSPALRARLVPSGQNPVWQLTNLASSSFFRPISSEKKGKSGIRPYCALIDEVHEHPDNSVIEMLRAGTKGNQQALIFEITNSGFDRTSVCWDEHQYAVQISHGELENDAFFAYVCALDEEDDPFTDESCWTKANPLLGVSIQPEFIREQVREAQGMPSKEALVRRLHFCEWTDAKDGWLPRDMWSACEDESLRLEDYQGEPCYLGLDLSYTTDLTALAAVFPRGEELHAFLWFWKPKQGLQEAIKRDRVPYDLWSTNGYLELTEGRVIKLGPIAQKMGDIADRTQLEAVAYDRYRHRELADDLVDLGFELPMIEHPQGFRRAGEDVALWMPKSVETLENMIREGRLRVTVNPLLRWNVASVAIRPDPAGTDNRIFDKRKSRARIDGVVALAMAVGVAEAKASGGIEQGFVVL